MDLVIRLKNLARSISLFFKPPNWRTRGRLVVARRMVEMNVERTDVSYKPNPDYLAAPYEIVCVDKDMKIVHEVLPLRFHHSELNQAYELMKERKWTELLELSVKPYVYDYK